MSGRRGKRMLGLWIKPKIKSRFQGLIQREVVLLNRFDTVSEFIEHLCNLYEESIKRRFG